MLKRTQATELAAHPPLAEPGWVALPWHSPKEEEENGCRLVLGRGREAGQVAHPLHPCPWAPHAAILASRQWFCPLDGSLEQLCVVLKNRGKEGNLPALSCPGSTPEGAEGNSQASRGSGQASLCHRPTRFAALCECTAHSAQKLGLLASAINYGQSPCPQVWDKEHRE